LSPLDRTRLDAALQLAEAAIGVSDPNPRVGCIVGTEDGRILGQGHTQQAGGPHAEVMALRDAQSQGHDVRGATAWVTLEPCAHHGRTPPCCDALIAAGLARVVCAVTDPNPLVAGQGIARMRAAGIRVDMAPPDLAARAQELNIGFFSRMQRQRPWVRMKAAISLDGATGLDNGDSQWITGPAARADGQRWRRRAGAIVTGIGTVLADDPQLNVRDGAGSVQPLRVVLDSRLRLPAGARTLSLPGQVVVMTGADPSTRPELLQSGARVLQMPLRQGQVDAAAVLQWLAGVPVNEVHVEAGPRLNGSLLAAGLVDELLVYVGGCLLGQGIQPLAVLPRIERLGQAIRLRLTDARLIDTDLRVIARDISALPPTAASTPRAVSGSP
jgi:diaminohydroxyphosphoribosylaminopyrimidine deaminase/5-amino-6-(5-phosphoribosylamino)uracil reductase